MGPRETIKKLNDMGYRPTPQRAMILSVIEASTDHISAEEIHSQIVGAYPQVNISTVYRTLELLKDLGLVTETDLGGGCVKYHPAEKGQHHHLVCQGCGAVLDMDETVLDSLRGSLLRQYGFAADLRHLAIFGRCAACRYK